jgi:LPXTG-site transpeptidase (sortase) family protein
MFRFLSSRWVIALGFLLAFYGAAGTSALIHETRALKAQSAEETLPVTGLDLAPDFSREAEAFNGAISAASAITTAETGAAALSLPGNSSVPAVKTLSSVLPADPMSPSASPTPSPPEIPLRLVIASIGLEAQVVPAETKVIELSGREYQQWLAPEKFASGWHPDSAMLGEAGNTVLNGHHNVAGEVFGRLVEVEIGDVIQVYSAGSVFTYQIVNKMTLPEKYEQLDVRMNNARWILPSRDERLTLITCWPPESNTHRLIVVAKPLARENLLRPLD